MRPEPPSIPWRRNVRILLAVWVDEPESFPHPRRTVPESTCRVSDRRLSAGRPFPKRPRRHGRNIQLGPGDRGAKIRQADFPRRRIDAGKCGRRGEKSPAVRRGCLQRRGIRAREKRRGESAGVYRGGAGGVKNLLVKFVASLRIRLQFCEHDFWQTI